MAALVFTHTLLYVTITIIYMDNTKTAEIFEEWQKQMAKFATDETITKQFIENFSQFNNVWQNINLDKNANTIITLLANIVTKLETLEQNIEEIKDKLNS